MSKRRKKPLLRVPKLNKGQKIGIALGAALLVGVAVLGRRRIAPGLLTMSFLDSPLQKRGIRNNNPGNIILSNQSWEGKIPKEQNTDGRFEQFKSYAYGVRAMIVLLRNYFQKLGLNTIEQIIYRWNPDNPNYVKYVSDRLGIPANKPLTATKDTLKSLVKSIADFENGIKSGELEAISDDVFEAAWSIL